MARRRSKNEDVLPRAGEKWNPFSKARSLRPKTHSVHAYWHRVFHLSESSTSTSLPSCFFRSVNKNKIDLRCVASESLHAEWWDPRQYLLAYQFCLFFGISACDEDIFLRRESERCAGVFASYIIIEDSARDVCGAFSMNYLCRLMVLVITVGVWLRGDASDEQVGEEVIVIPKLLSRFSQSSNRMTRKVFRYLFPFARRFRKKHTISQETPSSYSQLLLI